MVETHVIRLHGPWEYLPLARSLRQRDGSLREQSTDLPPGGRVQMPCDWADSLGHDFRGRVRYTRHFNCPTGLDPTHQVWLVFGDVDRHASVTLNEKRLGAFDREHLPARFEITTLLQPHNILVVEVDLPNTACDAEETSRGARAGHAGGLTGDVRLEILWAVDGPIVENA